MIEIALANHQMAMERFSSDRVAKRVLSIFDEVSGKQ
jgi:hypothetical protein